MTLSPAPLPREDESRAILGGIQAAELEAEIRASEAAHGIGNPEAVRLCHRLVELRQPAYLEAMAKLERQAS